MTTSVYALENEHRALGAEFMDWNGLQLATGYSKNTVEQELDAVRQPAGMYDLTAFRMLWQRGSPSTLALQDHASSGG